VFIFVSACCDAHFTFCTREVNLAPAEWRSVATQPTHVTTTSSFVTISQNTQIHIHIMGRLSTAVAAAGVDAGNLPEKLPNVSLIEALLPASWSSRSSKVRRIVTLHIQAQQLPSRGGE
jgi:hypothetical protein